MGGYMSITAIWAIFQSISSTVPLKQASMRNMPHLTVEAYLGCANTKEDLWS